MHLIASIIANHCDKSLTISQIVQRSWRPRKITFSVKIIYVIASDDWHCKLVVWVLTWLRHSYDFIPSKNTLSGIQKVEVDCDVSQQGKMLGACNFLIAERKSWRNVINFEVVDLNKDTYINIKWVREEKRTRCEETCSVHNVTCFVCLRVSATMCLLTATSKLCL